MALLTGGLGLVLWATVGGHSTGLVVLVAGVGSVLPARSAWRSAKRWRRRRKRDALISHGLALDVTHPLTRRLVDAYDSLLEAARSPGVALADDAVGVAHAALVESASLLDGTAPSTPAERHYLEKRIAAIDELTGALNREHEAWHATARVQREEQKSDEQLDKTARAEAREEVETILGESSLQELGDLTPAHQGRAQRLGCRRSRRGRLTHKCSR